MNYTADDATLYYPSVFSDPIEGKVMDRTAYRNSNKLLYPKFESASRDIRMKDIGKGLISSVVF